MVEQAYEAAYDAQEADRSAVVGGALYEYLGEHERQAVNVARIMREGVPPVEMALPGWLVAGELHWLFGDAESAKTWLALRLALDVMEAGGVVAWFDEELGEAVIAERLLTLGAEPEVVELRFAYFPFPSWQMTEADRTEHLELLRALRRAGLWLAVYDTATDMLAEADLDENSGVDVTRWVKAYPEQARQLGAAQLVLDHTGHGEKHRAVGSRAKRSKAKVQLLMELKERFDRNRLGAVSVTLKKNTRGADIPALRRFQVGGDGDGFVWQEVTFDPQQAAAAQATFELERRIAEVVREHGTVSQRQLENLVPGRGADVREAAKRMAASGLHDIAAAPGKRGAIVYTFTGPDDAVAE